MKAERIRAGGTGSSVKAVMLVLGVLLLAFLLGAALALEPRLLLPLVPAILLIFVLWMGIFAARRALGTPTDWHAWVLLTFWVLTINLPTFLSFDQTGFSRDHGLFNAQSLSRIGLFALGFAALAVFWVLWSRGRNRQVAFAPPLGAGLLFALYGWYLVSAPFVASGLSVGLAAFRSLEWLVAFALLWLLFGIQNARGQTSFEDRLRLVLPMVLFAVGITFLMLIVRPEATYQRSEITGLARLGNPFAHPNLLAMASAILFAYAVALCTGWRRVLLAVTSLGVLGFTYSRGGYATLAVVLLFAFVLLLRHFGAKVMAVLVFVVAALVALQFPSVGEEANRFLSRGNEREGLTTLSERTAVWEAAKIMIRRSPWLGEGFIAGPKELGDVMVRARLSNNFAAPHAHNELLQAQISGGIVATLLSLAIQLRIVFLLLFRAHLPRQAVFFMWAVFLSVTVWGLLGPSLSYFLSLPGVLLGWCVLTLEGLARQHRQQSAKREPTNPYQPAGRPAAKMS